MIPDVGRGSGGMLQHPSIPRLALLANWWGSSRGLLAGTILFRISFSRHFMITEVSAAGRCWLGSYGWGFLRTGMMVDVFPEGGY